MEFGNEYNVFVEKTLRGKVNKRFCTNFKFKEQAIKFALEMLLISNGKLTRKKELFSSK